MQKLFPILFFLFYLLSAKAQHIDGDVLIHIQTETNQAAFHETYKTHLKFSFNPTKMVLFIPLFLYQRFISEQLSASCEFEPSCSNFALQSIQKLGFFKGLFLAADRLTRCNGEAQPETQYYLIDHHSGKVIDEPEMYKIKD
jgi:putative membrane protein insertion efficiency factor